MMDENDRSHEDYRSLRHISRKEGSEDTAPIEVDSSAFFSELPPEQPSTPPPAQPPQKPPRSGHNTPVPPKAHPPGWSRGSTFQVGENFADLTRYFKHSGTGAAVAHPDAAGAVSGHSGRAAGAFVAAGKALSGVQCARKGVPGVLGVPVRLHGAGLCLGPAGSDRTGQHDQRSAHRCRGQQDHQGAVCDLPQRRGHPRRVDRKCPQRREYPCCREPCHQEGGPDQHPARLLRRPCRH